MKDIFLKIFLISLIPLSGCNMNLTNSNVCREDIQPFFTIEDGDNPSISDQVTLSKINKSGFIELDYQLQYVQSYANDENTYIRFQYDKDLIVPEYIYRLQYNENTYFIHSIRMANDTYYRYCDEQTTYKINQCESSGYNISINPSCAIPTDQADSYFENEIKPTM